MERGAREPVGETRGSPAGAPAAVAVRGIAASYEERGRRVPVLAGVTLALARGEFLAVIGPSGSGKSTLLNAIAGLVEPDAGEIALDGVALPARERLRRTAYMHQRDLLLPWRTAVQNAALALEAAGSPRREARAAARARLPEFGLEGYADAYPAQLSGGMRQRVAFLRTLLSGRPLVLLDEPFGALDALTRVEMQDWLAARLAADPRSLVLVTHDVEEAIVLADRVVVLGSRPGRIVHETRIDLPRPRGRAVVTEARFVALKAELLAALGVLPGGSR